MPEQLGNRVQLTVTAIKGKCYWGHKVGDQCDVSLHQTGGICGVLDHNIFHKINVLQFGGKMPWQTEDTADFLVGDCPDARNRVEVELRRIR